MELQQIYQSLIFEWKCTKIVNFTK